MTDINEITVSGGASLQELSQSAQRAFAVYRAAIEAKSAALQALEGEDKPADVEKQVRDFAKITAVVIEQEQRLRDEQERSGEAERAGEIDLAAAHAEIGRRLACLRESRNG